MARNPYTYDNMVIDGDEDISKVLPFFELFNENNKFTDTKFNVLNSFPSSITKKRITDTFKMSNGMMIPNGLVASSGEQFDMKIHNDRDEVFEIFWIDHSGEAKPFGEIEPNDTHSNGSVHIGHFFYLRNKSNPDEVLVVKVGDDPISTSGETVGISSITATPDDFHCEPVVFCDELAPYSSKQGQLGDCYLLSCLISTYSYDPETIKSLFLYPEKMKETGAVVIRLYNRDEDCWKTVILDDYLPMDGVRTRCAGPSGEWNNEYWVSFLEKAFAKLKGANYSKIRAGASNLNEELVMGMLVGPVTMQFIRFPKTPDNGETFDKILELYENGAIITFGSRDSTAKKTNIAGNHAYGLIEIMKEVTKKKLTLIKCHNPWSEGGEWNGDWSDNSPLWDKNPDVKEELGFDNENDGTFWIDKKDIHQAFEYAQVGCWQSEDATEEGEEGQEGEEEQEEEYAKESVPSLNAKPNQTNQSVSKVSQQKTPKKSYSELKQVGFKKSGTIAVKMKKVLRISGLKKKHEKEQTIADQKVGSNQNPAKTQKSSSCSIL